MDKPALSTIIVLLLLLAAQVHALECQETTASSSSGASGYVSTTRTGGDLAHDAARESQSPASSYAGHDAKIVEAARGGPMLCSKLKPSTTTSSPNSSVSSAVEPHLSRTPSPKLLSSRPLDVNDTATEATRYRDGNADTSYLRHGSELKGVRAIKSNSDSAFVATAAPPASVSSNTPVVSPSVKSSFLELSSSPAQAGDGAVPTSAASPTSKETVSTGTASLADQSTTNTHTKAESEGSSSSHSSASRLVFYSCLVVGVAGLVGAVLVYSIEWRAGEKYSDRTSTPSATWAPRPSEVHVVMDGLNFAIL